MIDLHTALGADGYILNWVPPPSGAPAPLQELVDRLQGEILRRGMAPSLYVTGALACLEQWQCKPFLSNLVGLYTCLLLEWSNPEGDGPIRLPETLRHHRPGRELTAYRLDRDRAHLVRVMVWCLREWHAHDGVWA